MEFVTTQHRDQIFEIILNRPDKRNAIRVQMLESLADAVVEAEQHPEVRVIILRGEGDCFSAGLDLSTFGGMPEYFGDNWMSQGFRATRLWQQSIHRLYESFLPSIA